MSRRSRLVVSSQEYCPCGNGKTEHPFDPLNCQQCIGHGNDFCPDQAFVNSKQLVRCHISILIYRVKSVTNFLIKGCVRKCTNCTQKYLGGLTTSVGDPALAPSGSTTSVVDPAPAPSGSTTSVGEVAYPRGAGAGSTTEVVDPLGASAGSPTVVVDAQDAGSLTRVTDANVVSESNQVPVLVHPPKILREIDIDRIDDIEDLIESEFNGFYHYLDLYICDSKRLGFDESSLLMSYVFISAKQEDPILLLWHLGGKKHLVEALDFNYTGEITIEDFLIKRGITLKRHSIVSVDKRDQLFQPLSFVATTSGDTEKRSAVHDNGGGQMEAPADVIANSEQKAAEMETKQEQEEADRNTTGSKSNPKGKRSEKKRLIDMDDLIAHRRILPRRGITSVDLADPPADSPASTTKKATQATSKKRAAVTTSVEGNDESDSGSGPAAKKKVAPAKAKTKNTATSFPQNVPTPSASIASKCKADHDDSGDLLAMKQRISELQDRTSKAEEKLLELSKASEDDTVEARMTAAEKHKKEVLELKNETIEAVREKSNFAESLLKGKQDSENEEKARAFKIQCDTERRQFYLNMAGAVVKDGNITQETIDLVKLFIEPSQPSDKD